VLFVDDDERVLRAIRRLMQRTQPGWRGEYEDSPRVALSRIDSEHFDVVVTDMHMPVIDGAQLLTEVQARHPEVVRVVLSGDPEAADIFRCVPVAHQFLTKPFEASDFTTTLDRALELREVLQAPELQALVAGDNSVPSAPRAFLELNELLADADVSMAEVAEVLSRDVGMTARVMQMAGSAFFSVPRTLRSVEAVAAYLGLQTLRALVLSAEVFELFKPDPRLRNFSVSALERHSLVTARLAQRMMHGTGQEDSALLAAMLHDVGLLVLASRDPAGLSQAVELSNEQDIPLHQAERRLRGAHHGEIGAYLLGLWGLPLEIIDAVRRHHDAPDPGGAEQGRLGLAAAVYFANNLADESGAASREAQRQSARDAGEPYLRRAGLGPSAHDWEEFAHRLSG